MLGKDIKSIILAYKDCIDDSDDMSQLLSLGEKVLKELIIGRPTDNFFDEERASVLYDITQLDLVEEDMAGCLRVIRNCRSNECARQLCDMLESFSNMAGSDTVELLECASRCDDETLSTLESYIDALETANQSHLGSLSFLKLVGSVDIRPLLNLKNEVAESVSEDEDVESFERLTNTIEQRYMQSTEDESIDIAQIHEFVRTITKNIADFEFGGDESVRRFKDIFFKTLENLVNGENIKYLDCYIKFSFAFDTDEISFDMERVFSETSIRLLGNEEIPFGEKLEYIVKITNNIDLCYDGAKEYDFIRKLSDLSIEQLKRVEYFTREFCKDSEAYEHLYFFTDPKLISEYPEFMKILVNKKIFSGTIPFKPRALLKANGSEFDKFILGKDSIVENIQEAIDDDDDYELENALSAIPDDEDITPISLKFRPKKQNKKYK